MSQKETNERRISAMTDAEILDLLDRATAYASRLINGNSWRGSRGGVLPNCSSAQDLVQTAFEKILNGAKWDEGKEFGMILYGIIRGTVKNLVNSWENQRFSNPEDDTQSQEDDEAGSAMDRFASAESTAVRKVTETEDEDRLLELIESLKEGSEERKIVEAIVFSGASKRGEVLEETGMNEKEYEAAKKRLRRFLENYRQERAAAHQ